MVRVTKTVRFSDGLSVPELKRFQCRKCGANFFDDAAMAAIEQAHAESRAGIRQSRCRETRHTFSETPLRHAAKEI
jgi:hypothetical protein